MVGALAVTGLLTYVGGRIANAGARAAGISDGDDEPEGHVPQWKAPDRDAIQGAEAMPNTAVEADVTQDLVDTDALLRASGPPRSADADAAAEGESRLTTLIVVGGVGGYVLATVAGARQPVLWGAAGLAAAYGTVYYMASRVFGPAP